MQKILGTMSVRIFLIAVIGVFLTAIAVHFSGQRDFREHESSMREQFAFERVENIIRILEATVPEKRLEIQDVFSRMGSQVTLNATPPADTPPLPAELAGLNIALVPSVADQISLSKDCPPSRRRPPLPPDFDRHGEMLDGPFPHGFMDSPPPPPPSSQHQCLAIYTHLEDSTPVRILLSYGRHHPPQGRPPGGPLGGPPNGDQSITLILLLTGLILVTWLVASVATKPLRRLAEAALHLAQNIEHPPLPEKEGPIEVRHAAKAFNEMQRSILKHVQERAFILGAIAHDLQTPLTRLRLRLEKVKDPELKQKLISDLTATQEMVTEGLDFARLSSENIQKNRVDLRALAIAVCDDFSESGQAIATNLPHQSLYVMGSTHLLKRCLTNLLSNAIAYAHQPALDMTVNAEWIDCVISDHGPGIPEHELETILEPFRRVEDSRSRHTGGTGLGLSIARMIVEKHGGKIMLRNQPAPKTGLIITIRLPRQT